VCEQSLYNLFVREVELEVIPAARDYGLGVIAWSPLHGGLLGGILRKQLDGARRVRDGERAPEALVAARAQIQAYEDLCAGLSEEPGTVALAWLLRQPALPANCWSADNGPAGRCLAGVTYTSTTPRGAFRRPVPGPEAGAGRLRVVNSD